MKALIAFLFLIAVSFAPGNAIAESSGQANPPAVNKPTKESFLAAWEAHQKSLPTTVALKKTLAKETGLEKIELQSFNLNINPNFNGGHNDFSGPRLYASQINMSISVFPGSKAFDFMAALEKKGFSPSLNMNTYRNCR